MESTAPTRAHKIRTWCLSTLFGAMAISILCNIISDTIPNPINYVIRWIKGEQEQAALGAPQPRLDLLLSDKTTPLKDAVVAPEVGVDFQDFKNSLSFPVFMLNASDADTGPLRFTYYLDRKFPRPEGASDTKEPGYKYELRGAIATPSGGNLLPGSSIMQPFGIFFGSSVKKPEPGDYKLFIRIRSASGILLSEAPLTLRVS